jgi:hypothetical protein
VSFTFSVSNIQQVDFLQLQNPNPTDRTNLHPSTWNNINGSKIVKTKDPAGQLVFQLPVMYYKLETTFGRSFKTIDSNFSFDLLVHYANDTFKVIPISIKTEGSSHFQGTLGSMLSEKETKDGAAILTVTVADKPVSVQGAHTIRYCPALQWNTACGPPKNTLINDIISDGSGLVVSIELPDQPTYIVRRPELGSYREGGIVFAIVGDDAIGSALVVAPQDATCNGGLCAWGYPTRMLGATGINLFTGAQNTKLICEKDSEAACQNYPAAQAAKAYTEGSYKDWYLPSLRELTEIALQRDMINTVAKQHGGQDIANVNYWTSSERKANAPGDIPGQYAQYVDFSRHCDPKITNVVCNDYDIKMKGEPMKVRAVRSFAYNALKS